MCEDERASDKWAYRFCHYFSTLKKSVRSSHTPSPPAYGLYTYENDDNYGLTGPPLCFNLNVVLALYSTCKQNIQIVTRKCLLVIPTRNDNNNKHNMYVCIQIVCIFMVDGTKLLQLVNLLINMWNWSMYVNLGVIVSNSSEAAICITMCIGDYLYENPVNSTDSEQTI